jgi:hypothetical protein
MTLRKINKSITVFISGARRKKMNALTGRLPGRRQRVIALISQSEVTVSE